MKMTRRGFSRIAVTVGTVVLVACGLACSSAGPPAASDSDVPRSPDGKGCQHSFVEPRGP